MHVLYDFKSGYSFTLSPEYGRMGLRRKQESDKNRVDKIKVTYQNWDGLTRLYRFPCTVNDWEVYCNVHVILNRGD